MKNKKPQRKATAIDWLVRLLRAPDPHMVRPEYLGFNATDTLNSMTSDQLKLVSCMVATAQGLGGDMTRKAWRESNERKEQQSQEV